MPKPRNVTITIDLDKLPAVLAEMIERQLAVHMIPEDALDAGLDPHDFALDAANQVVTYLAALEDA